MTRHFVALVLAVAVVWPAHAAHTYTMDAAHCIPVFEFKHLGMTTQTGRFDRVQGKVVLDRAAHKGSVFYRIDTSSLNMGYGTEKPDSPGYQLFEVNRFPSITFASDELSFDRNDNVIAAEGQLTLLGVKKPVTVSVARFNCSVNPMNKREMCAGNATATIKRSEFGMLKYIPTISDEIKISIPVEAYKD